MIDDRLSWLAMISNENEKLDPLTVNKLALVKARKTDVKFFSIFQP